jgi:integrase
MNIMSEADIEKLLNTARSTQYYPVFYLAIFTGMRRSEFCALRWGDVDLILGQISVSRTIHQLKDNSLVFRPTKTVKGRRTIALTPSTIMILRAHRERQEALRIALSGETLNENDMVFCHGDFTPLKPDTVSGAWAELAERAGMGKIRLHDCRHSHVSILLKQNIHPKVVQERLGHATIITTLAIYSHVTPGLQSAATLRFDEAMNVGYNKAIAPCDQNVTISETTR